MTQAAATNGGKFGGNSFVHLTLIAPQTLTSATATTVTIHEVSGTTADLVYTNQTMNGAPSSVCGEPLASPPPYSTARYLDLPWNVGGHNGNYTVTATVSAVVGGSTQTVTLASPLTVDWEDLLITATSPSNPAPLLWDPNANNGTPLPLPLSVTFTAAYKAAGTATVKIYSSDNNVTPIRTLPSLSTAKNFLTTDGNVSFSWDGKREDGSATDKGIYLFQFAINDTLGVGDSDKSSFLSLASPAPEATWVSDDDTSLSYGVSYIISGIKGSAQSAASGQIDAYDFSDLSKLTQTLTLSDLTLASHTVSATYPITFGPSRFLVSVLDANSNQDRGGRNRYALQHNQSAAPTILHLQDGDWDILWCRRSPKILRSTNIVHPVSDPAKIWVNPSPSLPIQAAVNGSLFDDTTGYPTLGDVGYGTSLWQQSQEGSIKYKRWCFGMQAKSGSGPTFQNTAPMVIANRNRQRKEPILYRGDRNFESGFPYGFSDVGLLIKSGIPKGPETSLHWPDADIMRQRTAVGWTKDGNFFVICATNPGAGGKGTKTWQMTRDYFLNDLPVKIHAAFPTYKTIAIDTAVMPDGGSSSMLSYQIFGQARYDVSAANRIIPNILTVNAGL